MHQCVVVEQACHVCDAPAQVTIGAVLFEGELHYYESFRCPSCLCATEADNHELLEHGREAICAVHGRWSAHVRDLGPNRLEAIVALSRFLGVTTATARSLVFEARPIVHGALPEVARAQATLEPSGIQLAIVRLPD